MPHPVDLVADRHVLAGPDRDAAGHEVRVEREDVTRADDHVVAGEVPRVHGGAPAVAAGDAERRDGVADGVHPIALGHVVDRHADLPGRGGEDGLAPAEALAGRAARHQPPHGARWVQPAPFVGADEVVGIAHAQDVGAVARDPVGRGLLDGPLAPQRQLDDDGMVELTHGGPPAGPAGSPGRAPAT